MIRVICLIIVALLFFWTATASGEDPAQQPNLEDESAKSILSLVLLSMIALGTIFFCICVEIDDHNLRIRCRKWPAELSATLATLEKQIGSFKGSPTFREELAKYTRVLVLLTEAVSAQPRTIDWYSLYRRFSRLQENVDLFATRVQAMKEQVETVRREGPNLFNSLPRLLAETKEKADNALDSSRALSAKTILLNACTMYSTISPPTCDAEWLRVYLMLLLLQEMCERAKNIANGTCAIPNPDGDDEEIDLPAGERLNPNDI